MASNHLLPETYDEISRRDLSAGLPLSIRQHARNERQMGTWLSKSPLPHLAKRGVFLLMYADQLDLLVAEAVQS